MLTHAYPTGEIIANSSKVDFFPAKQADAMFVGKFTSPTALSDELRIYNRVLSNKVLCEQVAFGQVNGNNGCDAAPGTAIAFDNFPADQILQRGRHSTSAFAAGNNAPAFPGGVFGRSLENLLFSGVVVTNFNKDINNDLNHTMSVWFFDDASSGATSTLFDFVEGSGITATISGAKLTVDATAILPFSGGQVRAMDSVPYQPGAWHHLVLAIPGTADAQGNRFTEKVDVYLDGKQEFTLSLPGGNVFQSVAANLWVGPRNPGETNLAVDELKIWTVDLRNYGAAVYC